jgi:hypothetical protein
MTHPRLRRLSTLSQGAALVGLGLGALSATACTKNDPQQVPAPSPTDTTAVTAPAPTPSASDSATLPTRHFPIPNAMPRRPMINGSGDGGTGAPDGG